MYQTSVACNPSRGWFDASLPEVQHTAGKGRRSNWALQRRLARPGVTHTRPGQWSADGDRHRNLTFYICVPTSCADRRLPFTHRLEGVAGPLRGMQRLQRACIRSRFDKYQLSLNTLIVTLLFRTTSVSPNAPLCVRQASPFLSSGRGGGLKWRRSYCSRLPLQIGDSVLSSSSN